MLMVIVAEDAEWSKEWRVAEEAEAVGRVKAEVVGRMGKEAKAVVFAIGLT
jgi:hypothetical protein